MPSSSMKKWFSDVAKSSSIAGQASFYNSLLEKEACSWIVESWLQLISSLLAKPISIVAMLTSAARYRVSQLQSPSQDTLALLPA